MDKKSKEKVQNLEAAKVEVVSVRNVRKQVLPRKTKNMVRIIAENPGISQKEAGRRAGYKHASSANRALMNANQLFLEKMDKAGLTEEALLGVTAQGLAASNSVKKKKVITVEVEGQMVQREVEEDVNVPDHHVRHRFLDTAWKLRGKLKEVNNVTNNNTLIVSDRENTLENIKKAISQG